MFPAHPEGETLGHGTNRYGVRIRVVRTPLGSIHLVEDSVWSPNSRQAADAFTNPETWRKVTGPVTTTDPQTANEYRASLKKPQGL